MIFRYKIAALTEAEQAEFKRVIRNHAAFDQKAGLGNMSAEMKEAMRHNVERIKAYRAKKANDSATIPAWARNPTGKPPAGGSTQGSRPRPPPWGDAETSASRRARWAEEDARHARHAQSESERTTNARRARWAQQDAETAASNSARRARWAREDAETARRSKAQRARYYNYSSTTEIPKSKPYKFPEPKKPSRGAVVGGTLLGLGALGLGVMYAHRDHVAKNKVKDTERSDKGKTHKKNYSYTSPAMKKAANYEKYVHDMFHQGTTDVTRHAKKTLNKTVDTIKSHALTGGLILGGAVLANKGVNYAVDRHRDKLLAKDIGAQINRRQTEKATSD